MKKLKCVLKKGLVELLGTYKFRWGHDSGDVTHNIFLGACLVPKVL